MFPESTQKLCSRGSQGCTLCWQLNLASLRVNQEAWRGHGEPLRLGTERGQVRHWWRWSCRSSSILKRPVWPPGIAAAVEQRLPELRRAAVCAAEGRAGGGAQEMMSGSRHWTLCCLQLEVDFCFDCDYVLVLLSWSKKVFIFYLFYSMLIKSLS